MKVGDGPKEHMLTKQGNNGRKNRRKLGPHGDVEQEEGVEAYLQVSFARAEQPLLKGPQPLSLVWQPRREGPLVRDPWFSCCCYKGSVRVVQLQNGLLSRCSSSTGTSLSPSHKPARVQSTERMYDLIPGKQSKLQKTTLRAPTQELTLGKQLAEPTQPSNPACINSVALPSKAKVVSASAP